MGKLDSTSTNYKAGYAAALTVAAAISCQRDLPDGIALPTVEQPDDWLTGYVDGFESIVRRRNWNRRTEKHGFAD